MLQKPLFLERKWIVGIIVLCLLLVHRGSVSAGYTGPNRLPGDPPASVIGSIVSCGGRGGWCGGNAYIFITGSEPVAGYSITAIEGYHNGAGFSCGGPTCQVNLSEGSNTISFWAVSNYSDTSAMGNITVSVDKGKPNILLSLPNPNGLHDWYTRSVSISVNASDSTSGLYSTYIGWADGGAYTKSITLTRDGYYQIDARAVDNAGNSAGASATVKLDQTSPEINLNYPEPDGEKGWYVTPLYIEASSQDILSGLDDIQIIVDQKEPDQIFGEIKKDKTAVNKRSVVIDKEGIHQVVIKSYDLAGNLSEKRISIKLDMSDPIINIGSPTSMSKTIQLNGVVTDTFSGIEKVFINYGDGWALTDTNDGTFSIEIDTVQDKIKDGYMSIGVKVVDRAGNVNEISKRILVFNHTWPFITLVAMSISLGIIAMLDPRRKEWERLSFQLEKIRKEFNTIAAEKKK